MTHVCTKSMKLVRGTSLHHPSREIGKTLSSGFILKLILPRLGIQMYSLKVYKLWPKGFICTEMKFLAHEV